MSGEGALPAVGPYPFRNHRTVADIDRETGIWSVARERADTLALLRRRTANARAIADANPIEADRARIVARECEIVADMIEHGLHEGVADMAPIGGGQ